MTDKISGPFGQYEHGSVGGVLNTLCEIYNVPLTRVEHVKIGHDNRTQRGTVTYNGTVVAEFRWFEGIDHAVMRFTNPDWRCYESHRWVLDDADPEILHPRFIVTLNGHNMAAFNIDGKMATPQLHAFLNYPMLSSLTTDETYRLSKECGAFFQGGSHDPKGKWFLIEFWQPKGVKAWMDYLNANYVHDPKKWAAEMGEAA